MSDDHLTIKFKGEDTESKLKSFMNPLDGHRNEVLCCTLFPSSSERHVVNQNYVVTGSSSKDGVGEFILWDILKGENLYTGSGHTKPITALAVIWRKGIDYLITGSEDGNIIIWEWNFSKPEQEPQKQQEVKIIVNKYEFSQIKAVLLTPHKQTVTSIAVYNPPSIFKLEDEKVNELKRSNLFVSVSLDKTALVWNFDKIVDRIAGYKVRELGKKNADRKQATDLNVSSKREIKSSHSISNFNDPTTISIKSKNVEEKDIEYKLDRYPITKHLFNNKLETIKINKNLKPETIFKKKLEQSLSFLEETKKILAPASVTGKNVKVIPDIEESERITTEKVIPDIEESESITKDLGLNHTAGLLSVAVYTPKKIKYEPLIITGSLDKTIIIWEMATGNSIRKLNGHTKGVQTIAVFDPDFPARGNPDPPARGSSPILVSGSIDKTIIIWDLFIGVKIRRLPVEKDFFNDKKAEFVGLENGHTSVINSLCVFDHSPDQNSPHIVSCGEDGDIIIWDVLSGHIIRTINGGLNALSSVVAYVPAYCLSQKDKNHDFILVSCSKTKNDNIILWDFSTARSAQTKKECDDAITSITIYDPKDRMHPISLVAHSSGIISIWDISKVKCLKELNGHSERINTVTCHSVLTDNQSPGEGYEIFIASCDESRTVIIRRVYIERFRVNGELIDRVEENIRVSFQLKDIFVTICMVSIPTPTPPKQKGGSKIFFVKGNGDSLDKPTLIWPLDNFLFLNNNIDKTPILEEKLPKPSCELRGHSNLVRCIVNYTYPNQDDKSKVFLVTSSYDKTAVIWSLNIGTDNTLKSEKLRILSGHTDYIFTIAVYKPRSKENILQDPSLKINKELEDPYIITGSFDNKIMIWDTRGMTQSNSDSSIEVKSKLVLSGHSESVTSISIYAPEHYANPLLVTSGIDKIIIIWVIDSENISKTKILRKLTGHTDRVCSLEVYTPMKGSDFFPLIVSGGDDRSLIVWNDCLHSVRTMPTQAAVINAFDSDLLSEDHWPLMKEMTKQYGIAFWIENTGLYFLALQHDEKRLSFYKSFISVIKKTIRYTNQVFMIDVEEKLEISNQTSYEGSYRSLLRMAFDIDDVSVLQIILDCWVYNLNQDIEDPLTQRLYHASYFVRSDDLFLLAKIYPTQFINFIASLRLVKTSKIVNITHPKLKIHGSSRSIIASCEFSHEKDLWNEIIRKYKAYHDNTLFNKLVPNQDKLNGSKRQTVSRFLPLVNAANRDMLNAYIDLSIQEMNVDIFHGDVGKVVLNYLWQRHAYTSHVIQFAVYLLFVALYSYSIYRFESLIHDYGESGFIIAWFIQFFLLLAICFFFSQQCYRIYFEFTDALFFYGHTKMENLEKFFLFCSIVSDHFLNNVWNVNELCISALVTTGIILRIAQSANLLDKQKSSNSQHTSYHYNPTSFPTLAPTEQSPDEESSIRCVFAVATILVYFKLLYFLRPFSSSGPLVSMILQIAKDIGYFLIILLTMMCAFAQTFWVLNQNVSSSFFGAFWQSYLYSFMYMLGQGLDPEQFNGSASFPLNVLILMVFMLFMILLMLNLLIALMNDAFGRVREKGLAQWRLEQGGIILSDTMIKEKEVEPYIYVLTYASDDAELVTENQSYDNDREDKQLSAIDNLGIKLGNKIDELLSSTHYTQKDIEHSGDNDEFFEDEIQKQI